MRFTTSVGVSGLALLLGLVGCGQIGPESAADSPKYSLTVQIDRGDTPATLEARYGGKVGVWQPQDGFAVLGLDEVAAQQYRSGLSAAKSGEGLEANRSRFWPGATLAWMSGTVSAWAGGTVSAWAGGTVSAWAGGTVSAWAGGIYVPLPQNTAKWQQVGLQQAQTLASNLGAGVTVAVIDSGVDLAHPGLKGGLATKEMWDYVGRDGVPQEEGVLGSGAFGHGTSVAAIVLQIAPRAKILPLRVLGPDGSGDVLNVAAAISHAVKQGADVINLSLGSEARSAAVAQAIAAAADKGVYVVASSGNSANQSITFPASEAGLDTTASGMFSLGVGSVDASDNKSVFSTYGSALELVAPGEVVFGPVPGNKLGAWSGTSMAAPMVAGALALALGQNLDVDVLPQDLPHKLKSRTANIYRQDQNLAYEDLLGEGRLSIAEFLLAVMP